MTKEVLTLALEALKLSDTVFYPQTKIAIAAIERALANHIEDNLVMVQEPIGEARLMQNGFTHCIWSEYCVPVGTKLYTAREKNA